MELHIATRHGANGEATRDVNVDLEEVRKYIGNLAALLDAAADQAIALEAAVNGAPAVLASRRHAQDHGVVVPEPSPERKARMKLAEKSLQQVAEKARNMAWKLERRLTGKTVDDESAVTMLSDIEEMTGLKRNVTIGMRWLGYTRKNVLIEGGDGAYHKAFLGIRPADSDGKLPEGHRFALLSYDAWDHWMETSGDVEVDDEAVTQISDIAERMGQLFGSPRLDLVVEWLQARGFWVQDVKTKQSAVHGLKVKAAS